MTYTLEIEVKNKPNHWADGSIDDLTGFTKDDLLNNEIDFYKIRNVMLADIFLRKSLIACVRGAKEIYGLQKR